MSHLSRLNVPIWLIHRGPHGITFIAVQRASQGQFGAVEITSITPSPSNKISSLWERPHSNCTVIFGSPYSKANTGGSGRETSNTRCKWRASILAPRAGLKLNSTLGSHYCDSQSERDLEMNSQICFTLCRVANWVANILFAGPSFVISRASDSLTGICLHVMKAWHLLWASALLDTDEIIVVSENWKLLLVEM